MKIAIPTVDKKLCSHFGHCETFTFAEINTETGEIISLEEICPDDGISCQSASWVSEQGVNVVLAGGMGGKPLEIFERNGVTVVSGCQELEIENLLKAFINKTLVTGENMCGGEHHHCHHGIDGNCKSH